MAAFEVGRSTVYQVFKETRQVLNNALDLPGLPDSIDGLRHLADDFQRSRSPPSPLPGCVGALDGISIRIKKPSKDEHPATFYCRKGFYALPIQALVNSDYRFICFSALCRGSTHDALAHAVSSLGRYLEDGRLEMEYWIAGDEAYNCSEYLITPVPASMASDVEDAFNFYHSSLRMHVEQSFGMLIKKFRILKMLEYSVKDSAEIVAIAMKLHNFCLENSDKARFRVPRSRGELREERRMIRKCGEWYESGKQVYLETMGRKGGSTSVKRDMLIEIVREGRYTRPAVGPLRIPRTVLRAGT